ncbi:toll/interleukin-1 receptor domain-containing protein [Leptothoe sp. ISB3NOV94-8A]
MHQVNNPVIEIFVSSCPEDNYYLHRLDTHLSILKRNGKIKAWHAGKLIAGDNWEGVSKIKLRSAQIILLLISADFIASDYCYNVELRTAISQRTVSNTRVIPIIVKPCDWQSLPIFRDLEILPNNRQPVAVWPLESAAFTDIACGIRRAVDNHTHLLNCQRYLNFYQSKLFQDRATISLENRFNLWRFSRQLELSPETVDNIERGYSPYYKCLNIYDRECQKIKSSSIPIKYSELKKLSDLCKQLRLYPNHASQIERNWGLTKDLAYYLVFFRGCVIAITGAILFIFIAVLFLANKSQDSYSSLPSTLSTTSLIVDGNQLPEQTKELIQVSPPLTKEKAIKIVENYHKVKPKIFGNNQNLENAEEIARHLTDDPLLEDILKGLDRKGDGDYVEFDIPEIKSFIYFCSLGSSKIEIHLLIDQLYRETDSNKLMSWKESYGSDGAAFGLRYTEGVWKLAHIVKIEQKTRISEFRRVFWGTELSIVEDQCK